MQDRFSRNVYFDDSLEDDVEGDGSISGLENRITLLIFKCIHVVANRIALF